MERRDFLVRTGLMLGAAAFTRAEAATDVTPASAPADWEAVRAEFSLDRSLTHLASFYLAAHPRPVREAIEHHRQALDANPVEEHRLHAGEHEVRVLTAAASYLSASPLDIALTDSTTMGLGLTYSSLKLREGQEILQSTHDYYSTNRSLQLLAQRTGATLRQIQLYPSGAGPSHDQMVGAIRQALTDRTRVVALTWVHSCTGVKLPIRAIADVIADANRNRDGADRAILCVDGVHGLGVEDQTMPALGCDFFIAGCHKWLLGPRGTGLVWGKPEAWELARQTIPPFYSGVDPAAVKPPGVDRPRSAPTGLDMSPGGFHSFEHRWALAEAFAFHARIGKSRVTERIHALNRQMKEGLAKMKHVTLHTPMSDALSAGIVCFEVAGLVPRQVVERLREKKVLASVTPYAVEYARMAAGLLNNESDVEAGLRAVSELG